MCTRKTLTIVVTFTVTMQCALATGLAIECAFVLTINWQTYNGFWSIAATKTSLLLMRVPLPPLLQLVFTDKPQTLPSEPPSEPFRTVTIHTVPYNTFDFCHTHILVKCVHICLTFCVKKSTHVLSKVTILSSKLEPNSNAKNAKNIEPRKRLGRRKRYRLALGTNQPSARLGLLWRLFWLSKFFITVSPAEEPTLLERSFALYLSGPRIKPSSRSMWHVCFCAAVSQPDGLQCLKQRLSGPNHALPRGIRQVRAEVR